MAKHKKHRRHRRYSGLGDLVSMPSFTGLTSAFKGSVDVKGLLIGAAVGIAGTAGVRYAVNKYRVKTPYVGTGSDPLTQYAALLGGVAGGVGGYMLLKKKKAGMAKSLLVGAVGTGAALVGFELVKEKLKVNNALVFADYVTFPGLSGYDGVIQANPYSPPGGGYRGMLAPNPSPGMGALMASAMEGYGMGGEDMADLSAA